MGQYSGVLTGVSTRTRQYCAPHLSWHGNLVVAAAQEARYLYSQPRKSRGNCVGASGAVV
eukprot:3940366-Rhodomonas_salina.2